MSKKSTNNSRRQFLKSSMVAAAGFTIVPRHVLGGNGYIAPSDKLNLGAIGAGGKGFTDIKNAWNEGAENVVAVCDIDLNRAKGALELFENVKYYDDFREMLDQENLDGVTIGTPDHTHAVAAADAMNRGVHVYVEKPLTHNIKEARFLTELAREKKIVTQMGNQGASNPGIKQMDEWWEKKLIGNVSEAYIWTDRPVWPQGIPVPPAGARRPGHINDKQWDLFIGPAEYVDYDPLYHPFKWRGWWNFGTGALGDMGCHLIDPAYRVLGLGYPSEVECSVGQVFLKDWVPEYIPKGCPPSSTVRLKFPASERNASEVTMTWTDGGIRPFHPDVVPASEPLGESNSSNGMMLVGEKGVLMSKTYGREPKIYLNSGEVLEMPKDYTTGRDTMNLPDFGHPVNWTRAVKAGYGSAEHKDLTSSFDYAGPLTETVLMGNLAIRSYQYGESPDNRGRLSFPGRKSLLWDGESMQITNYEAANQFVGREYREGWTLG